MNSNALAVVFVPNLIDNYHEGDDTVLKMLIDLSSELELQMGYTFPEFRDYGVEHYDD